MILSGSSDGEPLVLAEVSHLMPFSNSIPDIRDWQQKIEKKYQSSQIGD
jgi:hypothetical protein